MCLWVYWRMKYFSTFSGIGGFELGIQNAFDNRPNIRNGIENISKDNTDPAKPQVRAECVGYSEIDKYAIKVYERNFNGHKNYGDITKINADELPDFDCLVGGFPCQAFSIAGKRKGFDDTRGTLFFDLARILRAKQPRLFVFENVKGLLSHDNGNTFRTIIATLTELGYDCQWQVLNSKNHGVPQNRERIIIVGHLRGTSRPEVFPIGGNDNPLITKGGEQTSDAVISRTLTATDAKMHLDGTYIKQLNQPKHSSQRVYDPSGIAPTITAGNLGGGKSPSKILQLNQPTHSNDRVYGADGISPTLNTMQGGNRQPFVKVPEATKNGYAEATVGQAINLSVPNSKTRRGMVSDVAPTLDTGMQLHTLTEDVRIRRLTPVECERLQGFPDNWTKYGMGDELISDTQRYKMCGNAVTTNVIQAVFERLL